MDTTTLLGIVAGSLTTLAYLPQVVKTWRSRSADGVSWSMLIILCVGVALWLLYGLSVRDMPVICANVVTLALSSLILILKIRYRNSPIDFNGAGHDHPPKPFSDVPAAPTAESLRSTEAPLP